VVAACLGKCIGPLPDYVAALFDNFVVRFFFIFAFIMLNINIWVMESVVFASGGALVFIMICYAMNMISVDRFKSVSIN